MKEPRIDIWNPPVLPPHAATVASDEMAMARAVELARRGLGATSPNPVVGCVVLDAAGELVGEGFHSRAGGPHAEVLALAAAGKRARGGTAVVTLEPCSHTGRTGPCTEALIRAGVARVVVGVADPNPVAAGGAAVLREAGIKVVVGVGADAATRVNIAWLTAVRRGWPYVTWKTASTLDGRAAAADGSSRWITSQPARADVHRLRASVDAVMVGVGTVLTDDPQLTVRELDSGELTGRQPLRVVLDSAGRTPAAARVGDDSAPTLIATGERFGSTPSGRVDVRAVLAALFERGVRSVLLEGGPTLAGACLADELVDEVVAYIAPKLLGDGQAALRGAGVGTIADAIDLDVMEIGRIGPDLRVIARPRRARKE